MKLLRRLAPWCTPRLALPDDNHAATKGLPGDCSGLSLYQSLPTEPYHYDESKNLLKRAIDTATVAGYSIAATIFCAFRLGTKLDTNLCDVTDDTL